VRPPPDCHPGACPAARSERSRPTPTRPRNVWSPLGSRGLARIRRSPIISATVSSSLPAGPPDLGGAANDHSDRASVVLPARHEHLWSSRSLPVVRSSTPGFALVLWRRDGRLRVAACAPAPRGKRACDSPPRDASIGRDGAIGVARWIALAPQRNARRQAGSHVARRYRHPLSDTPCEAKLLFDSSLGIELRTPRFLRLWSSIRGLP
jgi:hypothetical protein